MASYTSMITGIPDSEIISAALARVFGKELPTEKVLICK